MCVLTVAVDDSELTSDRTLDDDDDNEEEELPATASPQSSQRSKPDSDGRHGQQASPAAAELERRRSVADDTADSELKDDDWTYPDDNSPRPRERRDSGVGSSLTRSSRYIYRLSEL